MSVSPETRTQALTGPFRPIACIYANGGHGFGVSYAPLERRHTHGALHIADLGEPGYTPALVPGTACDTWDAALEASALKNKGYWETQGRLAEDDAGVIHITRSLHRASGTANDAG